MRPGSWATNLRQCTEFADGIQQQAWSRHKLFHRAAWENQESLLWKPRWKIPTTKQTEESIEILENGYQPRTGIDKGTVLNYPEGFKWFPICSRKQ